MSDVELRFEVPFHHEPYDSALNLTRVLGTVGGIQLELNGCAQQRMSCSDRRLLAVVFQGASQRLAGIVQFA